MMNNPHVKMNNPHVNKGDKQDGALRGAPNPRK